MLLIIEITFFNEFYERKLPVINCFWTSVVATKEARGKVFDLLEIFEKDESLNLEMIILARFHYKFRNQWRREKCLRNMKQVCIYLPEFCDLRHICIKLGFDDDSTGMQY